VFSEIENSSALSEARQLHPLLFTTDGELPVHRFDAWRSHYESFNQIDIDPQLSRGFTAKNTVWTIGGLALSRNIGSRAAFTRATQHVRRDSIDHWVIRVAKVGSTRYQSNSAHFATRPNVPFLFSLGEASASERDDADWLSLYIPRDNFPELTDRLDRVGAGLLETPMGLLLGEYMMLLERRINTMTTADIPALVETMRSMIAACVTRNVDPNAAAPGTLDIARREQIRRAIRRHYASASFGQKQLSALTGISRSQLYRIFEQHGGVAHYIQQWRLRAAHAMLRDPQNRNSVQAIAEQVGFSDLSTFSRAFRREFFCSPTEARSAGRDKISGSDTFVETPPALEFSTVLRRLGVTSS
jgi:AraC-like DNA-binding protein